MITPFVVRTNTRHLYVSAHSLEMAIEIGMKVLNSQYATARPFGYIRKHLRKLARNRCGYINAPTEGVTDTMHTNEYLNAPFVHWLTRQEKINKL